MKQTTTLQNIAKNPSDEHTAAVADKQVVDHTPAAASRTTTVAVVDTAEAAADIVESVEGIVVQIEVQRTNSDHVVAEGVKFVVELVVERFAVLEQLASVELFHLISRQIPIRPLRPMIYSILLPNELILSNLLLPFLPPRRG